MVTFVAGSGPLLVIVIVNVTTSPTNGVGLSTTFIKLMSICSLQSITFTVTTDTSSIHGSVPGIVYSNVYVAIAEPLKSTVVPPDKSPEGNIIPEGANEVSVQVPPVSGLVKAPNKSTVLVP